MAAVAVTALVVLLHVRYFLHAGALWRDEISSVEVANSPTLGDLLHDEPNDSVPLLWHADGVMMDVPTDLNPFETVQVFEAQR